MLSVPGYDIGGVVHAGHEVIVHRGRRLADNTSVLIKSPRSEHPSIRVLTRLRHEQALLATLDDPRITRAYGLSPCSRGLALILEDIGGEPLERRYHAAPLPTATFLELARRLTAALAALHSHGLAHRALSPASILIEPGGRVALIDFSLAGPSAGGEPATPDLERSFAYIAPEQTGRLNRPVDQRSDLYSLGTILFELLTGRPPFVHEDRLELVHAHVARAPPSPRALHPPVPEVIEGIVLRLLAKMADERYQRAEALLRDLERCQADLGEDGTITPFALGEYDRPPRLAFSDRLYGTEGLIHECLGACTAAERGRRALVIINGEPGTGKTEFLSELLHNNLAGRGQLLTGRCPNDPDAPFTPLVSALRGRLREILATDDDELDRWQSELAAAVGDHGGILCELLPELAHLLPPAPPPATPTASSHTSGDSTEAFRRSFDALLRSIIRARTPCIIAIDDLQWIDERSAAALTQLLEDPVGYGLLVLATSHATSEDGPDRRLSAAAAAAGAEVTELRLNPLSLEDTTSLLRDTLVPAAASLDSLAAHLHHQTAGNPLHTRMLLASLEDEGSIYFDATSGCWRWELAGEPEIDLLGLLRGRLALLPGETQALLGAAACIGPRFPLEQVARLVNTSQTEIADHLAPALAHGVLRALKEPYNPAIAYTFAHERLAELALECLPPATLRHHHRRLGLLLLESGAADDDRIFTAFLHLLRGRETTPGAVDERPAIAEEASPSAIDLARLGLKAGQRALLTGAYRAAARTLREALELLPEGGWSRDHELTLRIHLSLAEALQLLGDFVGAAALFDRALDETQAPLDRAELMAFRIRREINLRRFTDALATGRAGLAILGIRLPQRGSKASLAYELARLRWRLRKDPTSRFLNLPDSLKRQTFVIHSLLMSMAPAAYFSDFRLAAMILLRLANLTLEHGRTEISAFGVAGYGLVLAALDADYHQAGAFAALAEELLEHLPSPAVAAKVDFFVGLFILPWTGSVADAKGRIERSYLAARALGDFTYAAFAGNHVAPLAFLAGEHLGRVQEQAREFASFLRRISEDQGAAALEALSHLCSSLRGQSPETAATPPQAPPATTHATKDLVDATPDDRRNQSINRFYTALYRGIASFHHHEFAAAQADFDAASQALGTLTALATAADLDLYAALNLAELATQASPEDRLGYLGRAREHQARLATWADLAPENYRAHAAIASAAVAWSEGQEHTVLPTLNLAIRHAQDHGDHHRLALAAELATRFVLATNTEFLREHYLELAYLGYQQIGALAKLSALQATYSTHTEDTTAAPNTTWHPTETSTLIPVDGSGSRSLDLRTVIKATQALSGEIVLDRLLDTLIRIVMENAGARRCFLVLDHQGRLRVEAAGAVDPERIAVLESTPIDEVRDLPHSILKYVARSGATVVLDHAAERGAFTKDAYVREQALKSVLCMPIAHQSKVIGVLYLENNLATDVFTDDRLELLNQLAAQLAISVDNARLYESLDRAREQAVTADQAKTRFLMTMSHELRTPLNAIIGYTELIEEDLMDGVREGFLGDLHNIQIAALRLERTLESALELSRIEAGTFAIDAAPVDFDALLQEVITELRPSLAERDNHFELALTPVGLLLSDGQRLRYSLRSVLDNAIRFTESGKIALTTAIDATTQPTSLRLTIRDDGIGISAEHRERIFDAFTQADDSTTRIYEGSGVSLAVTRHICVALGGRITVDSEIGAGSCFTIELPLRRPADPG